MSDCTVIVGSASAAALVLAAIVGKLSANLKRQPYMRIVQSDPNSKHGIKIMRPNERIAWPPVPPLSKKPGRTVPGC